MIIISVSFCHFVTYLGGSLSVQDTLHHNLHPCSKITSVREDKTCYALVTITSWRDSLTTSFYRQ